MKHDPIYLNIGCGHDAPDGWTNIDASPTARLEKLPLIGQLVGRFSGNASRFPAAVRYGDLTRPGLFPANSLAAAYASHVLEHLALDDTRRAVDHLFAMLRPGGVLRVIVPDLRARAEAYLARSDAGDPGAAHAFMEWTYLGRRERGRGLRGRLRALFGNAAHLWMWDAASLRQALADAGFVEIRDARFGDAADPMFARVENPSCFQDGEFAEVALEARKPG